MSARAAAGGAAPRVTTRITTLAPLRQRSFRFQWPADLAVSWAFEMETIILGWYVLAETGSVVWLSAFGALMFMGTLLSPAIGMMGDRVGQRRVLAAMRAAYVVLAASLAALALADALTPALVLLVAALVGLVRPSDIGMRNALVGATMPPALLTGAIGLERVGMDLARIAGALSGAGLVAALGMGLAYLVVTGFYLLSLLLLLGTEEKRPVAAPSAVATTALRDLQDGLAQVRATPALLAALCLAFLANLAAYPLSGGLLPYVAREVYGLDRVGLGWLVASFAAGGLLGSLLLAGARGAALRPGRAMLLSAGSWFALLLAFAWVGTPLAGAALLALAGFAQSLCMVPMSVLLLRVAGDRFRGRVMGLRMLAIYGLPIGLLAGGPLVERLGFAATASLYAGLGLLATAAIALGWRRHLWPREAPANALRT